MQANLITQIQGSTYYLLLAKNNFKMVKFYLFIGYLVANYSKIQKSPDFPIGF